MTTTEPRSSGTSKIPTIKPYDRLRALNAAPTSRSTT